LAVPQALFRLSLLHRLQLVEASVHRLTLEHFRYGQIDLFYFGGPIADLLVPELSPLQPPFLGLEHRAMPFLGTSLSLHKIQ
jgi:hypothetical protein